MEPTLQLPNHVIRCAEITGIDDAAIINELPYEIRQLLGEEYGSGFDLRDSSRDIKFDNGLVVYQLGGQQIKVYLDT